MGLVGVIWTITSVVCGLVVPFGFSIALGGAGVTPGEVRFARVCFIVPGILLGLTEFGWLMITDAPLWWRAVTGVAVGLIVFVGLPEGLRWIRNRPNLAPPSLVRPTAGPPSQGFTQIPPAQDNLRSEKRPAKTGEVSVQHRDAVLAKLRSLYILSHDGITPAMMAGLENPPAEWTNIELAKMGEAWRVASEDAMPLSITAIAEPGFAKHSGLRTTIQDGAIREPPLLGIPRVFISNTSTKAAVTLQFFLVGKIDGKQIFRLDGEGKNGFGHQLERNDIGTKILQANDIETRRYILSPVTIQPQTTVNGSLPFVVNHVDPNDPADESRYLWFVERAAGFGEEKFTYELEVNDVISKKSITIPLPSKGYP